MTGSPDRLLLRLPGSRQRPSPAAVLLVAGLLTAGLPIAGPRTAGTLTAGLSGAAPPPATGATATFHRPEPGVGTARKPSPRIRQGTTTGTATSRFAEVNPSRAPAFRHRHFGTGDKYMAENMGAGVAVFDADGDGDLDLYFLQGAPWTAAQRASTPADQRTNRLFLRQDDGFRPAAETGLEDEGYGMGVAVGDVDGDGRDDVYVTNFGVNRLFRSTGPLRWRDETAGRGLLDDENSAAAWSTGATFLDADGDGDLDLYVANYVDFALDHHAYCGSAARGIRSYCHPDIYGAQADVFYRNRGDGRFEEATAVAGFRDPSFLAESKGLGVVSEDLDGDGRADVYVANDSTRNLLFLARKQGFVEDALLAGLGYSGDGRPEAGMGIAAGDVDGDGRVDLLLTHLDQETNTLYLNSGGGLFRDGTTEAGLAGPSLPWVGFGTQLFDMDLDGDLDLFVANGHIIDNIADFDADRRHAQPAQLFENDGSGRFEEVSDQLGLDHRPIVGRGAVAADWDDDGDLDLVVTQNDGAVILLENRSTEGRSVTVSLVAERSAPRGIGARLEFHPAGAPTRAGGDTAAVRTRWVHATSSYLSQPPRNVVLALPGGEGRLVVHWPSGVTDSVPLTTGTERHRRLTLREGSTGSAAGVAGAVEPAAPPGR